MNWLIIILILVVAIGPVLYLLPNAREKRLIVLREQARHAGLAVQITSVPKLDPAAHERVSAGAKTLQPKQLCTAYKMPVGIKVAGVEALLLLKKPQVPTILVNEVMPGWVLHNESSLSFWRTYAATDADTQRLQNALSKLPDDALALAIDAQFVSVFWLEKAAAESNGVDEIAEILKGLGEDLLERFGVITR